MCFFWKVLFSVSFLGEVDKPNHSMKYAPQCEGRWEDTASHAQDLKDCNSVIMLEVIQQYFEKFSAM